MWLYMYALWGLHYVSIIPHPLPQGPTNRFKPGDSTVYFCSIYRQQTGNLSPIYLSPILANSLSMCSIRVIRRNETRLMSFPAHQLVCCLGCRNRHSWCLNSIAMTAVYYSKMVTLVDKLPSRLSWTHPLTYYSNCIVHNFLEYVSKLKRCIEYSSDWFEVSYVY